MRNWLARLFGSRAEDPVAEYRRLQQQSVPSPDSRTPSKFAESHMSVSVAPVSVAPVSGKSELRNPTSGEASISNMPDLLLWLASNGVAIRDVDAENILAALRNHRKIDAIKSLREASHRALSLKQAKDLVDRLEPQHH